MLTIGCLPPSIVPDPSFSSVRLLLHGDGTNGGTIFTDSGPFVRTVTKVGTVTTVTGTKRFGTASISLGTTGSYLYDDTVGAYNINTNQDFTLECWLYTPNAGFNPGNCPAVHIGSGNFTIWVDRNAGGFSSGILKCHSIVNTATFTLNTFHHVALSRSSGVLSFYLDGVLVGTTSNTVADTSNMTIGTFFSTRDALATNKYFGNMDDLRVTIGVGRYPSAFTPPSFPFPNQ